ncbi:hypothetical protein V8E36_009856 [Tilletia maclaganii]
MWSLLAWSLDGIPSLMRYNTALASLIVTLLTAVTVKAMVPQYPNATAVCLDRCVNDPHSNPGCARACDRCGWAMDQGYLPQDDHSMPPSCESRCGQDKDCTAQCQQYQRSCCLPSFGCCPRQKLLCRCSKEAPFC